MKGSANILVFSIDIVFTEIIKRIIENKVNDFTFSVLNSFSDTKNISISDPVNLILVDDNIIGTSSYELVSYLRLNMKLICPIMFFGVSEHDGKRKAIMTGANYFIIKPFKPDEVSRLIQDLLH